MFEGKAQMISRNILLAGLLVAGNAGAATMVIVNNDGPDEGLNDPTSVSPVTGNSATTLGGQRLAALQAAADHWGSALTSAVPVRISAQFNSLDCTAFSGTLGTTGPVSAGRDFPGAPRANTWYVSALANSLAGFDQDPTADDIDAFFNVDIGSTGCLESVGWWYGIGGNTPGGQLSLYETALHELAHGLGFITFVDSAGTKALGFDDAFMVHLEDHSKAKAWPELTNGERAASSIDTGDLHWKGANVVAASGILASGRHASGHVRMFAPNPYQAGSSVSHWDTVLSPDELMEPSKTLTFDDRLTKEAFRDMGWLVVSSGTSFSLDVAVSGSGGVSSNPAGIACPGDCQESYMQGAIVQLTATPGAGWGFSGWSGACVGTSPTCDVTMSSARSATASFVENPPEHLLTVSLSGSGNVSSDPSGISCPGDCQESYTQGTMVQLTATPGAGWGFSGWSGACIGTSPTCEVTMSSARSATASFVENPPDRLLTVDVSGSGSVISNPAGISCPGDCQESYSDGSLVELTAAPANGWSFSGWSGACEGASPVCNVTMSAGRTVSAYFSELSEGVLLSVSVNGPGSVTSSPSGIACPGDCQEAFSAGALVGLTAMPSNGAKLLGWSGACSGAVSECSLTMSVPRSVTASFADDVQPKIAVTVPGTACGAFINAQADKLERQQARIFNPLGNGRSLWVICPVQSPLSMAAGDVGLAQEAVNGAIGVWWGEGVSDGSEVSCVVRRYSAFSRHVPGVSQDGVLSVNSVVSQFDETTAAPYVDYLPFSLGSGASAESTWYLTVTCLLPPGAGINSIGAGYGEVP